MQRRCFNQAIRLSAPLGDRLTQETVGLRNDVVGTPSGADRDILIRIARQADTASHMQEWLSPPGLQAPK